MLLRRIGTTNVKVTAIAIDGCDEEVTIDSRRLVRQFHVITLHPEADRHRCDLLRMATGDSGILRYC